MRKWWMIQIKSCVWHKLLKADFAPHTITVLLWDLRMSASQDKMIYNTKTKHTRSYSANYSMSLSFTLTQNECTKYSHWESFLKSSFYEWRTMNYYTLLNRYSASIIIVVHILTDSKIKIIKYYYLDK